MLAKNTGVFKGRRIFAEKDQVDHILERSDHIWPRSLFGYTYARNN